mgnify:CR=1 FL=1
MTELLLLSRDTDSSVGEKVLICATGAPSPPCAEARAVGGCDPTPTPALATESDEVEADPGLRGAFKGGGPPAPTVGPMTGGGGGRLYERPPGAAGGAPAVPIAAVGGGAFQIGGGATFLTSLWCP